MQLDSTITCPKCGHQAIETMPTDACQFFYKCKGCNDRLKPKLGDCCVFCSYGLVPRAPAQAGRGLLLLTFAIFANDEHSQAAERAAADLKEYSAAAELG